MHVLYHDDNSPNVIILNLEDFSVDCAKGFLLWQKIVPRIQIDNQWRFWLTILDFNNFTASTWSYTSNKMDWNERKHLLIEFLYIIYYTY